MDHERHPGHDGGWIEGHRTTEIARQLEDWADFSNRLRRASLSLSLAFAEDNVAFRPSIGRKVRSYLKLNRRTPALWFIWHVAEIERQVLEVNRALNVEWQPTSASAPLAWQAFWVLAEAAPARPQLLKLYEQNIREAFQELAKHIEIRGAEISHAAGLVARDEQERAAEHQFHDRFEAALDTMISEAGGVWTLTEAADHMGMSKAAVHKKIQKHQALAVMRDGRLLLPLAQFVSPTAKPAVIVDGLDEVLRLFDKAREGPAAALQFLTTRSPVLKARPIDALKADDRRVTDVTAAYLQLDGE